MDTRDFNRVLGKRIGVAPIKLPGSLRRAAFGTVPEVVMFVRIPGRNHVRPFFEYIIAGLTGWTLHVSHAKERNILTGLGDCHGALQSRIAYRGRNDTFGSAHKCYDPMRSVKDCQPVEARTRPETSFAGFFYGPPDQTDIGEKGDKLRAWHDAAFRIDRVKYEIIDGHQRPPASVDV